MRLLGDVHLIENEKLALPTISMSECLSNSSDQSVKSMIMA